MTKKVTKKWYASKTVWFNIASFIVGLAIYLQGTNLPPQVLEYLGMIVTVGNLTLRFLTNQGIER